MKKQKIVKELMEDYPLMFSPKLACAIGVVEAVFIQQINYWLGKSKHVYEGRVWIYNSYNDWLDQFPFIKYQTLQRMIIKLEKAGILLTGNFNKMPMDRTKWYTIDYDALHKVLKDYKNDSEVEKPKAVATG